MITIRNTTYSYISLVSATLLFLLPFVTSRHLFFAAVNAKFFFVLMGCYLIFALFAFGIYKKKEEGVVRKDHYLLWSILGFLGVGVISAFTGVDATQSFWSDIMRSTGLVFLAHIIILAFVWSRTLQIHEWSFLRRAVIVSSALFGFLYNFGFQGFDVFSGRVGFINFSINGLTMGNETFAGVLMFIAIMFSFIEIARSQSQKMKRLLYILLVFQFVNPLILNVDIFTEGVSSAVNFFGTAQASSLVAFAALLYFIVRSILVKYNVSGSVRWLNGLALIAVLVPSTLLFVSGSFVQEKYIDISTKARILTWEAGFESFSNRPIFGYGPENFSYVLQDNFKNELYLQENIGEIWFDKAHNSFVETITSRGIAGLVSVLAVLYFTLVVLRQSVKEGGVSAVERDLIAVLLVGHILQIFTSFDTVTSYVLLALVFGYVLHLENSLTNPLEGSKYNKYISYGMVGLIILSFAFVYTSERVRQKSLFGVFVEQDHSERLELIQNLDAGKSTFEPLRRGSTSLVKGIFESTSDLTQQDMQEGLEELKQYDVLLSDFVETNPNHYRAKITLVYIRYAQTFLGHNVIDGEVRNLIDESYQLSPENPLTNGIDVMYYVYTGQIAEAERLSLESQEMYPDIDFINQIGNFVIVQKQNLPRISFLVLENL
jgi:O-antigen ligase